MTIRPSLLASAILGAGLLTSCATADQVDQLNQRIDDLEAKVETMEKGGGSAKAPAGSADSAKEEKANELLKAIAGSMRDGDFDKAKTDMATLEKDYGDTLSFRKARKLQAELEVIGKDAPASFAVEKWFQGEDKIALDGKGTELLVFWEVWCPHCQREVPELEATYEKLAPQGLEIVGLTKITKSATEEKVTEFIKEKGVTYPMAKESGELSAWFNVSGIPAAAIVKDGKIVWRGHPGRLTDEMISGWL